MTERVDIVVSRRAECGEGPYWHAPTNTVYWVDIPLGEILSTNLSTGLTAVVTYPEMVGAVAPKASGGVVAAVASGFVGLDDLGKVTHRVDCIEDGIRMNDAKSDPAGRYWAGSCAMDFRDTAGGLWRLDENWNAALVVPGLTQPNGMGWSPDGSLFYLVETQAKQILSFPFEPGTSTLDPTPTVLVGPENFSGYPDGLAVDARGHLWVAEFAGHAIREFAPDGELLRTVALPTAQPTSCAFIGPQLDQLWVTSAAAQLDSADDPDAGSVFAIHGHGTTGLAVSIFGG
ncbi:SMP-30/gluconolactonase/LRE family protein [Rathayibacter soli]|uniref:SMP-30/gluconolactonase/LRE family protein n=1 Tax=Rathayibacter soli TaxID=3144168 RepID=UPI0027E49BA4|nr:SMP-30/gluconolactonase/LRE family protein [Glaciibacter superstes]